MSFVSLTCSSLSPSLTSGPTHRLTGSGPHSSDSSPTYGRRHLEGGGHGERGRQLRAMASRSAATMVSRPPRLAAAPPASPPRPAARPSGPPQTFLAGAPLRPSSMAPFPSRRRRGHGGARLRQSDSRGGAEAGRAVRGAARRTARTASAAARGGPRARRRRWLGVLVLPRSSLSGAPLSWLWRRPVTAAMAARGGQAMAAARPRGERAAAAACARRPHAEEPPLHGGPPRTGRGRRARRAPARPRGVRPRRTAASGGVRASARGHGEGRRPRRLGRRGGRTAAARVTRAATMVSWSVSWGMNLTSGVHLSVRRSA
ncbi:hypothetical protein PVAP13_2KG523105 [Panicum virgatum]|uniref:Uncharacterized protein n=1 Tax=Panicum virgatum TaxID=38727 RepID=A0A8T0WTP4_PANVG|nr:hypothetical protein PVAP13_2KG523105 [Panicum virgatum]